MEFDPSELTFIREDPRYIACVDRSRQAALAAHNRGEARPKKIVDDEMIEFYASERANNGDVYGKWFSNCVYAKINVDNETNISSEHYFQREKFRISPDDFAVQKWCREHGKDVNDQIICNELVRERMATMSPVQVAKFGQTMRSVPIKGNWDNLRDAVMWKALVAKFTQNEEFKRVLLDTGNRALIERAPTDSYWAINNNSKGENTLGVMLMAIRNLLNE